MIQEISSRTPGVHVTLNFWESENNRLTVGIHTDTLEAFRFVCDKAGLTDANVSEYGRTVEALTTVWAKDSTDTVTVFAPWATDIDVARATLGAPTPVLHGPAPDPQHIV